jgi:hypothetical protein
MHLENMPPSRRSSLLGVTAFGLGALCVAIIGRGSSAQTDLDKVAEWASAEGFVGELNGAPARARGYEQGVELPISST